MCSRSSASGSPASTPTARRCWRRSRPRNIRRRSATDFRRRRTTGWGCGRTWLRPAGARGTSAPGGTRDSHSGRTPSRPAAAAAAGGAAMATPTSGRRAQPRHLATSACGTRCTASAWGCWWRGPSGGLPAPVGRERGCRGRGG